MSHINWEEAVKLSSEGWSNYRIADRFGVHESTIRRGLKTGSTKSTALLNTNEVEDRLRITLDKPLVHNGSLAVTADWHIPMYDPAYANKFLQEAKDRGHSDLLIAGDFFNFDALSAYDPKQEDAGLEKELVEAMSVMRILLETFDNIYYLWGNHDDRMHRALGFKIQFKEAMKMVFGAVGAEALTRIQFTNLDHMWVIDNEEKYYVCHPKNYTQTPLATARKLASKYNANVITAHSHHCAVGYGVDGEKVCAEVGGLFDKTKTAYLQRSTTFPTWQQGYCFIEDGRLVVSSPGWQVG
ncbi:MAG TPA: metallophosphoesterase [Candidatus Paceibacterota bacterium]